jgi:hypothetical protein
MPVKPLSATARKPVAFGTSSRGKDVRPRSDAARAQRPTRVRRPDRARMAGGVQQFTSHLQEPASQPRTAALKA